MRKSIIGYIIALLSISILIGCANESPSPNRITKVQETSYPDGITISMYNDKLKKALVISDARMVFAKYKKQVQFIINNKTKDIYNIVVSSEWNDKRGMKISAYPKSDRIQLLPHSGKRMVIDAPNFKAKNIIINVECGNNCKIEQK